jgi:hypothetical protein
VRPRADGNRANAIGSGELEISGGNAIGPAERAKLFPLSNSKVKNLSIVAALQGIVHHRQAPIYVAASSTI